MKKNSFVVLLFISLIFISCHTKNVTDSSAGADIIIRGQEEEISHGEKSNESISSRKDRVNSEPEIIVDFTPSKKIANDFFEFYLDESMDVDQENFKLYENFENQDKYLVKGTYVLSYSGQKIYMNIAVELTDEQNKKMDEYLKEKQINLMAISLGGHWKPPFDFYQNNEIKVTEYIRDVANDWCSDDFGFFVKEKNTPKCFSSLNIYFQNIYSNFIEEGGYITPWNRETVKAFEEQQHPWIQFYYLIEKSMETIRIKHPEERTPDFLLKYNMIEVEKH
ncbi:MAG: hypothetical protein VZR56_04855 [Treponema sp.]|nr:hypothetical protein [Treponema sp.]